MGNGSPDVYGVPDGQLSRVPVTSTIANIATASGDAIGNGDSKLRDNARVILRRELEIEWEKLGVNRSVVSVMVL